MPGKGDVIMTTTTIDKPNTTNEAPAPAKRGRPKKADGVEAKAKAESGNGAEDEGEEEGVELSTRAKQKFSIQVTIRGITPLLIDAMSKDQVETTLLRRVREKADTDASLEELAAKKLYEDPDDEGRLGIDAECMWACLRDAGAGVKYDGKANITSAKGGTKMTEFLELRAMFIPFSDLVMWTNKDGTNPREWKPDVRKGTLQASGTAVGIVRPKFKEGWEFQFELIYTAGSPVPITKVQALMERAGKVQGLCSFRPSKKGRFGQFELVGWKVKELKNSAIAG